MYSYSFKGKVYSSKTLSDLQKQLNKVGFKGNVKDEIQAILAHVAQQEDAMDQYEEEASKEEQALNDMYKQLNASDEF